jgi:uncharacterized protein (TIGR02118 family)
MMEIAALLSTRAPEPDPRRAVAPYVEQLKTGSFRPGREGLTVRGLVVSEVTDHLTEIQTAGALVQVWVEGNVAAAEVLELLVPAQARAEIVLDAWVVGELVFRQPVERERIGASPDGVKLAGTAYRRDDYTREAFFDYWRDVHAPISGSVPGLGGYVVHPVHEQLAGEIQPDALLELWWPDRAVFEASGSAPQQEAAWEDVQRYAKTTGTFWLMRESVIVPPPPTGPGTLEVTGA